MMRQMKSEGTTGPDCSMGLALVPPGILCLALLVTGLVAAQAAKMDLSALPLPYLATGTAITFVCVLGYLFIAVAKLGLQRADSPIGKAIKPLVGRAPLLVLPAVALPMSFAGLTAAKSAIPFLVGYTWDAYWANLDRTVFGDDVWRLAHRIFGTSNLWLWEWSYAVAWGVVLFFGSAVIALFGSKRLNGIFFTTLFTTLLLGGCLLAYVFSSAGPVFAHLFDPSLDARFAPLRQFLATNLGQGPIGITENYLASAVHSRIVVKGGGMSAMPSMHLAVAAIYILLARGTKWLIPAILFWIIIFIGSGYFGYHYWMDGLVGSVVAWICWVPTARLYRPRPKGGHVLQTAAA